MNLFTDWLVSILTLASGSSTNVDNFDLILGGDYIWLGGGALSQNLLSGQLPTALFVTVL